MYEDRYSTPRIVTAVVAAIGGVGQWFWRRHVSRARQPVSDQGLADPMAAVVERERRVEIHAAVRSAVSIEVSEFCSELRASIAEVDAAVATVDAAVAAIEAAAAATAAAAAAATAAVGRQRSEEPVDDHPSPASDASDFLHVMCFDTSPEQKAGLARHLMTQAGDLPYDRIIASTAADASVQDALALLARNKSSCIRVDRANGSGVMDVTDATVILLQPQLSTISQPVGHAVRLCASVGPSLSMRCAVQYLKQGYDYLTVRGREDGIISQAGVLRWLHQFLLESTDAEAFVDITAGDLASDPMTASCDATARSTLRTCLRSGARSLALVDSESRVVGVLSLSDIKCLAAAPQEEAETMLGGSALDFVRTSRQRVAELWATDVRPVDSIVQVTSTTTVLEVLRMVVTEDVHCVYILEDDGQCIGVVTTVDLLNCLVH